MARLAGNPRIALQSSRMRSRSRCSSRLKETSPSGKASGTLYPEDGLRTPNSAISKAHKRGFGKKDPSDTESNSRGATRVS